MYTLMAYNIFAQKLTIAHTHTYRQINSMLYKLSDRVVSYLLDVECIIKYTL